MHLLVTHRCPTCGFQKEYAFAPGVVPFEHCKGVLTEEVSRRHETLTIGDNGKLVVESDYYAEKYKKLFTEKEAPRPPDAWKIPYREPGLLGGYAKWDAKLTMQIWEAQDAVEREEAGRRLRKLVLLIELMLILVGAVLLIFGLKPAAVLAVFIMSVPVIYAVRDLWRSMR